ncbi:uncharacterized protein LOC143256640 [Tachypleus tridentatus]|uniref:uncharacterized protein LOC143256640 n=1 Tax=Tachypleus tridentatus TaxID=6853 RepID=UPI003FD28162
MKAVAMETSDDSGYKACEDIISVRVFVPDLQIEKLFQFHQEELVWDVKQQILSSLPKELNESVNYGLFTTPKNGKAGKFLDEERFLIDYPFSEPVGYLELRYKRRVYKTMNTDEKQVKQLHTRTNLRRMIDYVNNGNVDKIIKLCAKGLDPNFHCPESGESPLMLATTLHQPAAVLMELVNGGAHLDYRMKDGRTALHRAVEKNNFEAIKSLLDLRASPNYKDNRGLTPLYYSVSYGRDPKLTECLLHDHAIFGMADHQGWQEVHQACKHGLVQHLEHLLFYGADINSRNASGNTPLHVCAVNDQESCARVLLFRGANKNALNYANQSAYQVAVIAGNHHMAEVIQNHRAEDVVPYRETPQYNLRRRASVAMVTVLNRTDSDPHFELVLGGKPPSPCPSYRSLPPFSSVSTISEASTGSSSTCTQPSGEDSEDTTSASVITERSITSDSSGVCTSNSGASESITELFPPGTTCVCMEDYYPCSPSHLQLTRGDILDIVGVSDCGLLEGRLRNGVEGLFPSSCVQEIKLRQIEDLPPIGQPRVEGRREMNTRKNNTIPRRWKVYGDARTVILHKGKKGFGFVLRGAQSTSPLMERQVTDNWPSLQYLDDVDRGGIADLAGLKKGDFLLEINGQDVSQAPHEKVVAIIRQSGDLVAMTVVSVQTQLTRNASDKSDTVQRQCATLPRKLSLKKAPPPPRRDPRTTLSVGRARARSLVAELTDIEALDRTVCEYDSEGRSTKSSSIESISNKPGNSVTESSKKVASTYPASCARDIPSSKLESILSNQREKNYTEKSFTLSKNLFSLTKMPKVYASVAAMKRSKATRSKTYDVVKAHKAFHSTPDLSVTVSDSPDQRATVSDVKRYNSFGHYKTKCLSQEDIHVLDAKNFRHSWAHPPYNYKKCFGPSFQKHDTSSYKSWKSIEDLYDQVTSAEKTEVPSQIYAETLPLHQNKKIPVPPRTKCPPSTDRPQGLVVKVDVSRSSGEYANITTVRRPESAVMSSFRPGDSAKIFVPPESMVPIGYKATTETLKLEHSSSQIASRGSSFRSHSVPPKISGSKLLTTSSNTFSEMENSADSGEIHSTFRMDHKQIDSLSSNGGLMSDNGTLKIQKHQAVSRRICPVEVRLIQKAVNCKSSEPFIPEPDYESSEEEVNFSSKGLKDQKTSLGDKLESTDCCSSSSHLQNSHMQAMQAIQEARTKLKLAQGYQSKTISCDHKLTVSANDTKQIPRSYNDRKICDGDIGTALLRCKQNELGENSKLIGIKTETMTVSPTCTMSCCSDHHEYLTENDSKDFCKIENIPTGLKEEIIITFSQSPVNENISVFEQKTNSNKSDTSPSKKVDGLHIAITGPENRPQTNQQNVSLPLSTLIRSSKSFPKNYEHEDIDKYENSSSGVSSDVEIQNESIVTGFSSEDCHKLNGQNKENLSVKMEKLDDSSVQTEVVQKVDSQSLNKKINTSYDSSLSIVMNRVNHNKILVSSQNSESYVDRTNPTFEQNQNSSSAIKLIKTVEYEEKRFDVNEMENSHKKTFLDNQVRWKKVETSKPIQCSDESLQLIRLEVDSLGRAAVNEVDVLTELVPPPPEFAALPPSSSSSSISSTEQFPPMIAPPPEFY